MSDAQAHRGPDDAQTSRNASCVLGHTRLAIIDPTSGGRQPFSSLDRSVQIVFNGEIYNHNELRTRFDLHNLPDCDGAILPALWARFGTSCFRLLRGMYAIAVFDSISAQLTLARDPFGVKPLYWCRTPDGLAFASEVRALALVFNKLSLRHDALSRYLEYGSLGRDESPFDELECVPANTWITFRSATQLASGLVDPAASDPPLEVVSLPKVLTETVDLHLRSDVPCALLLSSGLDSAAVAWAAAELGRRLTCVTVEMGGGRSEARRASRIAARFGHEHLIESQAPSPPLVGEFFDSMQRPTVDGLNTYLVSRAIRRLGIKVALSGLGGDEMLGGYPSFQLLPGLPVLRLADRVHATHAMSSAAGAASEHVPWVPAKAKHLLAPSGPRDAVGLGVLSRTLFTPDAARRLLPTFVPSTFAATRKGIDARSLSEFEIANYLGGTLLPDGDAFSMAHSVELRVPYVDVPFARAALNSRTRLGVGKKRFARELNDPMLVSVAKARKQGFSLPMDKWMRSGALEHDIRRLSDPDAPIRGLLRPPAIDGLLHDWLSGRVSWSRAWSLAALNSWLLALRPSIEVTYY